MIQAAQAVLCDGRQAEAGGQDGRSADTMAQEALEKFSDAVAMCRAFIEGTGWALKNTGRSSAAARERQRTLSLCAYIYGEVMEDAGRSWSSS